MKTVEEILNRHCNYQYNKNTGEKEVLSSESSVIIAMEEYAKEYVKSLLPSHKEISERKFEIVKVEDEFKGLVNSAYALAQIELKEEILNKLQ